MNPGTENYSLEAPMMADGRITVEIALEALGRLEVDSVGLDEVDHKLL
jgi:Holliday junction resolvasome RuvABC ATP-dependent DNA helicase subunit